jgi:hypothetical protein
MNNYVYGCLCIEVFFLNNAVLVWSFYCYMRLKFITLYTAPVSFLHLEYENLGCIDVLCSGISPWCYVVAV